MTDEGGFYRYGRRVTQGVTAFEDGPYGVGKMPFSAFNAVPWAVAEGLGLEQPLIRLATRNRSPTPSSRNIPREDVFPLLTGRLATVCFSALLAVFVFRWSRELYGFSGGIVSLFLYAFSPTLLAHSHLVTVDLYAALGVTAACYLLWRFLRRGGWGRAALSALSLGLAQLAKYTCLYLVPLFAVIGVVHSWPRWVEAVRSGDPARWRRHLAGAALVTGLFLVGLVAVLHVGYLGQGTLTPLSEYQFQSDTFTSLQKRVLAVADIPVPLPSTPVVGLDALHHYERSGSYFSNLYLLGELRLSGQEDLEGFKSYYLVSWLFKVPIATQLVLLVALWTHRTRSGREYLTTSELALFGPLVFYVLFFSLGYKAQIGIRHFLVVFPLVFVLCGAAARVWPRHNRRRLLSGGALAVYLVASVLSYYPHFLSYFNELVWDRKQAYKIVADSSIDMQGGLWFLERYLAEHPGTPVNPAYIEQPGTIVVEVNQLTGVLTGSRYDWLRENFEPVDHVGYAYLVYEIRPEDLHLVPRTPFPSTYVETAVWVAANVPEGAAILREDGTPSFDAKRFHTGYRPSLGEVPERLFTSGRWDYAVLSSATYDPFLLAETSSDGRHHRIAERYREILAWPIVADFQPDATKGGPHISLHRVDATDTDYRSHRRWSVADVAWVSDPAIRPREAGAPLLFTRRWQGATFKAHLEKGVYEVALLTEPTRPEAYVELVTLDGTTLGPFRVDRSTVVEFPRRDKYWLRVYLEPGASLSEVVVRPAAPDSAPAVAVVRELPTGG